MRSAALAPPGGTAAPARREVVAGAFRLGLQAVPRFLRGAVSQAFALVWEFELGSYSYVAIALQSVL